MSVYRTIGPLVLMFDPKHRSWILDRSHRRGGSNVNLQSMFLAQIFNNIKFSPMKFPILTAEKISLYITFVSFRNDTHLRLI